MIEISGLAKAFGSQVVLDGVDLNVPKGEILVVLGESGAGKSVLLKHIIGLLRPDKGTVCVDSQNMSNLSERKLLKIRTHIGYLFQEGALYDFMNVFDNIAFPLREHTRMTRKEISHKIKDILALIDMEGVENKLPSELSGGMKKRVALARSIILDCKVLLCDEPTSGLDPIRSRDITDLIRNVSKKMNSTTIITSHDMANSFRVADRLILFKNGKIAIDGNGADFQASTNPFVQSFIE